jgi:hypothetical protein
MLSGESLPATAIARGCQRYDTEKFLPLSGVRVADTQGWVIRRGSVIRPNPVAVYVGDRQRLDR